MFGVLPESLNLNGEEYDIRHDYRDCFLIFDAVNDPELTDVQKKEVIVYMLYSNFHNADELEEAIENGFPYEEALKQAIWFLSCGKEPVEHRTHKTLFNWKQDEHLIFSAINKVADREVRSADHMHFWTFVGYFQEVSESAFSYVVGIRDKLARREKLDKSERRFYQENKVMVDLKRTITKEEQDTLDFLSTII